jgi:hypothetical protein
MECPGDISPCKQRPPKFLSFGKHIALGTLTADREGVFQEGGKLWSARGYTVASLQPSPDISYFCNGVS